MFDLKIISPRRVIFEKEVSRVWLDGDDTEYEFLSFHAPCIGVLREGNIVIDGKVAIPIRQGVARFVNNECMILVEENEEPSAAP